MFINLFSDIKNETFFNFENLNPNPQKILIEFPSPNTNKSLHIGHVRNMILGKAISNIYKKIGDKVILTNLNSDRGIAICKSLLMYQNYGKEETPETNNEKPDLFAQKFYEMFNKSTLENKEELALELLERWEKKDEQVIKLWKQFLKWVYLGYEKTYKNYKMPKFDYEFYESKIYDKGVEIILKALKNNCEGFFKDEKSGAIGVKFNDKTIKEKILLRGNGTSLYMTQDIYLAELKNELFEMFHNEKDNLFKAINKRDYENIHKIAHKLKGAALNLRLSNLALILKKIDELSKEKAEIDKIEYLIDKFYKFLKYQIH